MVSKALGYKNHHQNEGSSETEKAYKKYYFQTKDTQKNFTIKDWKK